MASSNDQILAFDYESCGKLDHLVLYRSGTGLIWIISNLGNGNFSANFVESLYPFHPSWPAKEYVRVSGNPIAIENTR